MFFWLHPCKNSTAERYANVQQLPKLHNFSSRHSAGHISLLGGWSQGNIVKLHAVPCTSCCSLIGNKVPSLHASANWCTEPEPSPVMHFRHSDTISSPALSLIFIPSEGFQPFKKKNITLLDCDIQERLTNLYEIQKQNFQFKSNYDFNIKSPVSQGTFGFFTAANLVQLNYSW